MFFIPDFPDYLVQKEAKVVIMGLIMRGVLESLNFRDKFGINKKKRASGVAELRYTMLLYGKFQF